MHWIYESKYHIILYWQANLFLSQSKLKGLLAWRKKQCLPTSWVITTFKKLLLKFLATQPKSLDVKTFASSPVTTWVNLFSVDDLLQMINQIIFSGKSVNYGHFSRCKAEIIGYLNWKTQRHKWKTNCLSLPQYWKFINVLSVYKSCDL